MNTILFYFFPALHRVYLKSGLTLFFFFFCSISYCQDSVNIKKYIPSCSIYTQDTNIHFINKKRAVLVTVGNIAIYSSTLIGLSKLWYSQYPRSKFHFFNDNAEWLQMDKAGHAFSAYIESYGSCQMWKWTGISEKKAVLLGGLSGIAYQSIIEILDGFSAEYGFSIGDFGANVFGAGLFAAEQFAWNEQRIKLKFSFHKKNYGAADLNQRANDIFGKSESERFIKDYNASTEWVSVNLKAFEKKSNFPAWIAIAFGYGAEGMFGARRNIDESADGTIIFNRSDIKRYRQWYIAPDIDLTKIRTHKKSIKIILGVLNAFKFPTPSCELSNGTIKFHWFHF